MKSLLTALFFIIALNTGNFLNAQSDSTSSSILYKEPESFPANLSLLTPPEGFVVSDQFNGYIHYQVGAAIIMTLIKNISYLQLSGGMTEDFYKENQLTKLSESPVLTKNGTKGIMYKFYFNLQNTDFIRYMVYVGDLNQTLWLNITYPKLVDELMEPELLKSIQTINFNTTDEK